MKLLKLPQRIESHERYEANEAIYALISKSFTASVKCFIPNDITTQKFGITMSSFCESCTPFDNEELEHVSTIANNGDCAILCFQQGLAAQVIYKDLETISKEIAETDHYKKSNTVIWHCLFDHFGLKRASHYVEIIAALQRNSVSTCLVSNALYHNNPNYYGEHFVNVVGIDKATVFVDDPRCGRIPMDFRTFLEAVQISWIW